MDWGLVPVTDHPATVLTFWEIPLVMTAVLGSASGAFLADRKRWDSLVPWLILAVCLGITYQVWMSSRHAVEAAMRTDFAFRARESSAHIEKQMQDYEQVLRGVLGLFAGSDYVTRSGFHSYINELKIEVEFPGIEHIGYIAVIPPEEKDRHIAEMKAEGFSDYAIRPATPGDMLTSVLYVEPATESGLKTLGRNLHGSAIPRAAMELARDLGAISLSGKLNAKDDASENAFGSSGILMFVPVYRKGASPGTIAERRKALSGWIFAFLRIENLMNSLVRNRPEDCGIAIYDGIHASNDACIYKTSNVFGGRAENAAFARNFQIANRLEIADRAWTVVTETLPGFPSSPDGGKPFIIGLAGVGVSLLMTLLTWLTVHGRARAQLAARNLNRDLIQSEAKLRSIVHNTPESVILIAPDGRFLEMNPAGAKLTGLASTRQASGYSWDHFLVPEHVAAYKRLHESVLRGETGTLVFDILNKYGERRTFETRESPMSDETQTVVATLGLTRDITERERARIELVKARQAAESANYAKSEFLANMSHEIRTPMTAIVGYAEMLLDSHLDRQKGREALLAIHRSSVHLLQIINDILDLSKIESGKMEIDTLDSAPWLPVAEVLKLFEANAKGKGIRLCAEAFGPIPTVFPTDPLRLRQILFNLVGNAVKFTSVGQVTVRIFCSNAQPPSPTTPSSNDHPRVPSLTGSTPLSPLSPLTPESDAPDLRPTADLHYEIADQGPGIPPELMDRLFQPFTQADASTTRLHGGTGLGLAISQRLAAMLGGEIAVVSQLGVGSRFILKLPIRNNVKFYTNGNMLNWEALIANAYVQTRPPVSVTKSHALRGKILLADDSPDNRKILSYILKKQSDFIDLTCVENGRQAVGKATKESYDLILMDIQMPEVDGNDATGQLRARGYLNPIVALTAHAMSGERENCLARGFDDYLRKPVEIDRLQDVLQRYLHNNTPHVRDEADATEEKNSECGNTSEASEPNSESERDAEDLNEFLTMRDGFHKRLREYRDEMRKNLAEGRYLDMSILSHQLAGAAGMYGYPDLSAITTNLEIACEGGSPDQERIAQLEGEFHQISGWILERASCESN